MAKQHYQPTATYEHIDDTPRIRSEAALETFARNCEDRGIRVCRSNGKYTFDGENGTVNLRVGTPLRTAFVALKWAGIITFLGFVVVRFLEFAHLIPAL